MYKYSKVDLTIQVSVKALQEAQDEDNTEIKNTKVAALQKLPQEIRQFKITSIHKKYFEIDGIHRTRT